MQRPIQPDRMKLRCSPGFAGKIRKNGGCREREVPLPTRFVGIAAAISILGGDRDSTLADPFNEAAIVAKVLVGVFNRELANRVIERRI